MRQDATRQWPDALQVGLDGVRVWGSLYQGALPATGPYFASSGFRVLVICAAELCEIRTDADYPGTIVLKCPLRDELRPVDDEMWQIIDRTVDAVVSRVNAGSTVLVACQEGKNRSALVTAAAIMKLAHWDGAYAVEHIKRLSPRTFSNEAFAHSVRELR